MKPFLAQLKFDSRRLILRNFSFQFFSILMPAGFYLLFTKVMVSGTVPVSFSLKYMASMIVYSGTINALFGIASILMLDREKGLLQWYQLTPSGVQPYYLSVGFWSMAMNGIAIVVLGVLAVSVNHVSLTIEQWLVMAGVALVGQIPTLLLGVLISFLNRIETLSIVSNLITFPMAIVSGLWWPMSMLPSWLQPIGKLMPTYFVNNWLGAVATHATLKITTVTGVGAWIGILLILVVVGTRQLLRRGDGVVKA